MRHLPPVVLAVVVACASASASEPVPLADDPAVPPAAVPAAEPVVGRTGAANGIRPFALAAVRLGSSARVGHGVERRREDGEVVDGSLAMGAKAGRHLLALGVGTDANATEAGELDVGLSYNHADYLDLVAVHDLTLDAGWSGERHWVLDGDLLAGPLHLAAGSEDGVRTCRLGGGLGVRLRWALVRFTCDRLIITRDDDDRALATGTALQIGLRPIRHTVVQVGGAYTRDALTAAGPAGVWEAGLTLGVGF